MKVVSFLVVSFAVALGLLLGPAANAAHAEETGPISVTPTPLVVSKGKGEVTISNNTGTGLTLSLAIVDKNGNPVSGEKISPASPWSLAPGGTAVGSVELPASASAGTLVVITAPTAALPQGAVSRVPLLGAEPVKAAVSEWTLANVHPGANTGTKLPLTGPCENLALSKPAELGTVQAEGEALTVTGSCGDGKARQLELAISRPETDGRDYKGKIKVGEGEVELKVEDKLCAGLAALFIGIGLALAFGTGYYQSTSRPAKELVRQSRIVEAFVSPNTATNVETMFRQAAAELGLPQRVREWSIESAVRAELASLRKKLRGGPSEDTLKSVRESLAKLELELLDWPKMANRLGELQARGQRLAMLRHYYPGILGRTLGRTGPIDLDAMRDVKAAAEEAVTLANDWPSERIEAAQALASGLPAADVPSTFEAALQRIDAATSTKDAERALEAFWSAEPELLDAARQREPMLVAGMAAAGGGGENEAVFEPAPTGDPVAAAASLATQTLAIDILVALLLFAVALIGGMQLLWVGKSFGGFWDVCAALAWGLGTGAISKPLSEGIIDVGRSWAAVNSGS